MRIIRLTFNLVSNWLDSRFYWIFGFLLILFLLPLWLFDFVPFVDYPQHLALVSILRQWDYYQDFFSFEGLWAPNVFFYFFCYVFSFLGGVETASKFYLTLTVGGLPLVLLYMINKSRGDKWYALLGLCLMYNFNAVMGFLGFIGGIPLLLYLIYFIQKTSLVLKNSLRKQIFLALCSLVLFWVHFQIFFFFICFYLAWFIFRKSKQETDFKELFFLLPASFLSLFWFSRQIIELFSLPSKGNLGYTIDFRENLKIFSSTVFTGFQKLEFLGFAIIVFSIIFFLIKNKEFKKILLSQNRFYFLSFLISAVLAFVLPLHFGGQDLISVRANIFLVLFLILLLCRAKIEKLFIKLLILFFTIYFLVNTVVLFALFNEDLRPLRILKAVPEKQKVFGSIYEMYPESGYIHRHVFLHSVAYYQVWNSGLVQFSPTSNYLFTLNLKPGVLPTPISSLIHWLGIIPEHINDFDYFIVRGAIPFEHYQYYQNMELIFSQNKWHLYKVWSNL